MMARSLPWGLPLLVALALGGCANYRDDLDRAADHYNNRRYEEAAALLEVLEPDLDSLSKAERVRYAFFRGMSYFLVNSELHARHWLGRAMARIQDNEDALRPDELKLAQDTLGQLNAKVYGGAETPSGEDAKKSCEADADCDEGSFCDAGSCRAPGDATPAGSASASPAAPAEAAPPAPSASAPASP